MGLTNLSTKRQRIAELARAKSGVALSTLHHVLDLEWMREAYRLTRKDGAPGIDGVTAAEYAQNLETNLSDLLERIKSGRYYAPPVRRVYIPKGDGAGSLRPLGLPTFEDKVAQRAVVMVLEAIYERDFLPCSYGFRPGRSAHQALQALRTGFMSHGLRWVIDLDIEKAATVLVGVLLSAPAFAQAHIRGTLTAAKDGTISVQTAKGGTESIKLANDAGLFLVTTADMSAIQAGKFVGITSVEQDGKRVAREVHVFDESLRGLAEGTVPGILNPRRT